MHGVQRTHQTKEAREARQRREKGKIEEFTNLSETVLSKKRERDWSHDAFNLTTKLLQLNPEFYTIWNYRRNILTNGHFAKSSPETINNLLADELSMTMSALKSHPKVYWIWNHRRWCLENIPNGPGKEGGAEFLGWKQSAWNKELFVVEKMLDADPRNFLAWNYRRYVLASMPVARPESAELAYTSRKIEANFSNFSAWHQRSKTLTSLWEQGKLDEAKSREQEFELLRNAMYTDPNDQSVWMYHRWLVGTDGGTELLEREVAAIQELLDEQPDSKWCMESIVHYKLLLLKKSPGPDPTVLADECQKLLKRLQELDPSRRSRYQELGKPEFTWIALAEPFINISFLKKPKYEHDIFRIRAATVSVGVTNRTIIIVLHTQFGRDKVDARLYHTRRRSALAFTGLALASCAATARGASAAILVNRSVCDGDHDEVVD